HAVTDHSLLSPPSHRSCTFLLSCPDHDQHPHSFPTRRSSDLSSTRTQTTWLRSMSTRAASSDEERPVAIPTRSSARPRTLRASTDRKSTRLNSSHEWSSYAVFCLQNKTTANAVDYPHPVQTKL